MRLKSCILHQKSKFLQEDGVLEDNIPFNASGDRQSHHYPIKSHLYSWLQPISAYANGVKLSPGLRRKCDFKLNEKMCLSSAKKDVVGGGFSGIAMDWQAIGRNLSVQQLCLYTRLLCELTLQYRSNLNRFFRCSLAEHSQ